MMHRRSVSVAAVALVAVGTIGAGARQAAPQQQAPPATNQQTEIGVTLTGDPSRPARIAVPNFIALSGDSETQAAARVIAEVLHGDFEFEREFDLVARNVLAGIPLSATPAQIAWDRFASAGADSIVVGSIQKTGAGATVRVYLYRVDGRQQVFAKEYSGASIANPRFIAHTIADEIHLTQGLQGVARTKLTFSSNRDGDRTAATFAQRAAQEIYISDYDGANQRRVTVNRNLNITPSWSPDAQAIAYTTYVSGFPDINVSWIYKGLLKRPAAGTDRQHNFLPSFSPDGTRIAFSSNRDGNNEIYVMNVDGSGVRRLTNHRAIDTTPTWSPSSTHIAFVSERSGSPNIWRVDALGLEQPVKLTSESHVDRPTWSPPPLNQIAYTSRTGGAGFDIKILDVATGAVRAVTTGDGSNESPAFSPTGRHVAFTTTRWGKTQIAVVARDGRGLKRITQNGENKFPNWSRR
jgi:TolB protein